MTDGYKAFLQSKINLHQPAGLKLKVKSLNPQLKQFQSEIVLWTLRLGRAAVFAGTGLGKTLMQLEWASQVHKATEQPVLVITPLAVSQQTIREGLKFGITVNLCNSPDDLADGINITNYEKLHRFEPGWIVGLALDESSILKSHDGAYRQWLTDFASTIPYRTAWTATPAPNDHEELGNHAEFLGILKRTEMLGTFFTHDGGDTSKWRLKGHAEEKFWKWLCSWAVTLRNPADLGFDGSEYELPPLAMHSHVCEGKLQPEDGRLFVHEAQSLQERRQARRASLEDRCQIAADLANDSNQPWVIWCDLNDEGDLLEKLIPDAIQIKGADSPEFKSQSMIDFSDGSIRVLITKPSIAGFGMNWQHCNNTAFVGLSDSWEKLYQAIRRFYRFGQSRQVNVHMIYASDEGAVIRNLQRKEEQAEEMQAQMVKHMNLYSDLNQGHHQVFDYNPQQPMRLPQWLLTA